MAGRFEKFWPMKVGGPYDEGEEAFKCTKCGAVTYPDEGWNGDPDALQCSARCRDEFTDWYPGNTSQAYRRNFDLIFPDAPGAGL